MDKKRKETRRIFKQIFRPSCFGHSTGKILECVRAHYQFDAKKDCKWFIRCLQVNYKLLEANLKTIIDSRPDLKKKYGGMKHANKESS